MKEKEEKEEKEYKVNREDDYLNLTAPQKINLNNSFSLSYTAYNKENINYLNNYDMSAYKYPNSNIHLNRTQLALNNMEKDLIVIKQAMILILSKKKRMFV